MRYHISMKTLTFVMLPLLIAGVLTTSCGGQNCDGTKCREELGLGPEKMKDRDAAFYKENPSDASRLNVFVENSVSMNGYVTGNTGFKTVVYRVVGQLSADVLQNGDSISFNYINSEIVPFKGKKREFLKQGLDCNASRPGHFSTSGGDRANSDIMTSIEDVIKRTPSGEISMFVSDCVYSPEPAADIDKALEKQQTDMLNALKNKAKTDPRFGVVLYRLTSDFHGIYYNKTNGKIQCDGPRPYFIWLFGDASILANAYRSLEKIMTSEKATSLTGIKGYAYLPYKTKKSDHPYQYLYAKPKTPISFLADISDLPLSTDYLLNKANYLCSNKKYAIKSIEKVSEKGVSDKGTYNYKFTIKPLYEDDHSVLPRTVIEISLLSPLRDRAVWEKKFDDPKGTDYDKGYNSKLQRTFGIKSLVEGIADFYNEKAYATFKVAIN